MNSHKSKLGIILFLLGLIGVLSILTMEIPIPEEAKKLLLEQFTPEQIKWITLINPSILLLIAVLIGTLLYNKVKLQVPIIEGFLQQKEANAIDLLKSGVIGGLIAGGLISLGTLISMPFLPQEFIELGEQVKPSLAARFLYGGLTEEILMRFGLMTLVVWIVFKITKSLNDKVYWGGILIAALIFALGHFPIAYNAVGNPSAVLLGYILVGNSIGGIVFGWLYWKKGLESAFVAHIFTHVVMLLAEPLM